MKLKLKIIQINNASSSLFTKNYKEDIFTVWYAQVKDQIKKYYPNLEVECWTIERKYKKEKVIIKDGTKFRIFPTNVSIRHSVEISLPMLRALKNEISEARKNNIKLIFHIHEHHTIQSYLNLLYFNKPEHVIISQHHGARNAFRNLQVYKKLIFVLPLLLFLELTERLLLPKVDIFYAGTVDELTYLKNIAKKSETRLQTMGIEEEYYEYISKKIARKKLRLNQNKIYILFIGRITRTKGIGDLLIALKKIKNKKIEFLLIGAGNEFEKYKTITKEYGLDNVKFLGWKFGKEKLLYLSASDYLILPTYTETCPVVLKEAIAKNLPVITTNVGGIPLMIKNGREGIIITPRSPPEIINAINEIITWKNRNVKKYAHKYKWRPIIDSTVKDYKRLLNKKENGNR